MKEITIDFLDEQTSLRNTPKEIDIPIPGTAREKWMYATGYISGLHAGLNKARAAIKSAVEIDRRKNA
jgi:hypothetical protein